MVQVRKITLRLNDNYCRAPWHEATNTASYLICTFVCIVYVCHAQEYHILGIRNWVWLHSVNLQTDIYYWYNYKCIRYKATYYYNTILVM